MLKMFKDIKCGVKNLRKDEIIKRLVKHVKLLKMCFLILSIIDKFLLF